MYAPTFPHPQRPIKTWHKVNPLDLVRPVCHSKAVVNCIEICEQLPSDAFYCPKCHRSGYPRPQS